MRAVWTGTISFGLVNIPVNLFSAVKDSSLNLDMLDERDHSNIHFKRVNENTGKEVPFNKIVKGYLYHDKYVVLEKADFQNADAKKTQTIEIQHFVDESEISSIYYEQPYYLEPQKTGVKAYAILRDALRQSGKAGVATFVMRNKEALAILKPYEDVILLNRIRFEEEIKDVGEIHAPPVTKARSQEQALAIQLIEQSSKKFDISNYKDTYTEKLMKVIKDKAKHPGKKTKPKMKVVHKRGEESDLMSVLKASLSPKRKAS